MRLLSKYKKELHNLADPHKANLLQKFFKTGKGEYAEGDKFLGITVPKQRGLIKNYLELSLDDLAVLLSSVWHEERLSALLILVQQYQKNKKFDGQKEIYNFYLDNVEAVNNWDLVDLSAPHIIGHHLFINNENRSVLYLLAQKQNFWQRRIAIVATHYFIRNHEYQDAILIIKKLLGDKEDLIHKACGWMLREIGKRDIKTLKKFLKNNLNKMPRVMLRYAIERFPEAERKSYLAVRGSIK